MPIKRYEMTEPQWNQIKNLFPIAKTGRFGKDNRIIFKKLHVVVDGLDNLVYFQLLSRNISDNTIAIDVLPHVELAGKIY